MFFIDDNSKENIFNADNFSKNYKILIAIIKKWN